MEISVKQYGGKNRLELKTINMICGGMKGPSLNHTHWKNTSVLTHLRSGSSELRNVFFFLFFTQNNK